MIKRVIWAICIMSMMSILLTGCCLSHDWQEADCVNPKTCSKCGKTEGEALGHDWREATCTEAKTCSVCGETEGEALGHDWQEATCTEAKTCSVCGEAEGDALGHTWIEATCTEPKICSVCGETEGDALGHAWIDATCLSPKSCERCGLTEGDIGSHIWVDATCQAPATCMICGLTDGDALEHQLDENGICILCNQQIGIPLTLDNFSDYLEFVYTDLTKEGAKTVKTGSGGVDGGMRLDFTLKNKSNADGSIRATFNYIKEFNAEFDIIIEYNSSTGLGDEHHSLTITKNDLESNSNGSIIKAPYKTTIYYGLQPDAINVYKTAFGTTVNYLYQSKVELKSVSGYVVIQ